MAERWWTDEDRDIVHKFAWDVHDGGGSPYLSAGAAAKVLDALAPTVERIRREAKAEALREASKAAEGMHDPVAFDCREWGAWLRGRAARIEAADA